MSRRILAFSMGAALLIGAMTTALEAQQLGASGHVSTLGVGGNLAIGLAPNLGVRVGFSVQPWEPSREIEDVDVTASFSSPVYSGLLDFYPMGGSFHLTGGVVQFGDNITMVGTPMRAVNVDGVEYQPDQIGSVTAVLVTKKRTPYLGIGWGNPARGSFGVTLDLGVAFQGEPGLNVTVDGPYASDPTFQARLEAEVSSIENDISSFKYYPVISMGLAFGTF